MALLRIPREEFLASYFGYRPGEHVSLIGPTQAAGKTTLAYQLLERAASPSLPAVALVMKPRDRTVSAWTERLGWREVNTWPPHRWPWQDRPAGHTLWPRHTMTDVGADNAHLADQFRRAILDTYKRGNGIVFGDEVYGLCVELGLSPELTAMWTRGGGMGAGLWSATQKPSGTQAGSIPSFVYNSATWTFLSRDPDKRNRDRFAEIGGVDGRYVGDIVLTLQKYEFLCIHRDGYMCIIGA